MRRKALKNAVKRVLRGGAFYYGDTGYLRTTYRDLDEPEIRSRAYGFRLIARKVR
jgi:formylglycine-generating enzyme required for sulfatase activity